MTRASLASDQIPLADDLVVSHDDQRLRLPCGEDIPQRTKFRTIHALAFGRRRLELKLTCVGPGSPAIGLPLHPV